jgi:hypothetical protein
MNRNALEYWIPLSRVMTAKAQSMPSLTTNARRYGARRAGRDDAVAV